MMRRWRWLGAAVLALGAAGALALKVALPRYNAGRLAELRARTPYDPGADAEARYAEALARAGARKVPLLVVLGGNWCQWCLALDELLHEDPALRGYLQAHFEVLKLDSARAEALDERWGRPAETFAVPVLVFLDAAGTVTGVQETVSLERWGGRLLAHDRERLLAVLRAHTSG